MFAGVSIEKMSEDDVDEVFRLSRESTLAYWSKPDYRLELLRGDAVCLIAKAVPDKTAGFVIMRLIRQESYGEIYNIAVAEKYRRFGIAGKLLDECIKACRVNNLSNILLEVRESNAAALSLYLKYGFTEIGRRRNFYTNPQEDAVSMSRILT